MLLSTTNISSGLCSVSSFSSRGDLSPYQNLLIKFPVRCNRIVKRLICSANSRKSDSEHGTTSNHNTESKPTKKSRLKKSEISQNDSESSEKQFPPMIPKKPRRGRKSEAAAVEDYVRSSLQRTFDSIREQNPEILENMENIMKKKSEKSTGYDSNEDDDESDDDEDSDSEEGRKMLIEEEDPNWPLDADIGWGVRASEYFDQHPIKNVLGEDGVEIDWEGEIDNGLVKEINCLEWESFAFHPSPLVVLVFERYNRASDNWKVLKELEKAAEVYWKAKDRLPPRTVKIDMNIERDLAYALKARECPQILFLRGNKILYREKDMRSSDELVQMIAYFYYNAKKPSCINDDALTSPRMRG